MASSSYLKTQRRKKNKEKDTLVNRKQGVDNIIGNISTGFDGDIINVNNLITTSALSLSSGIRGKKESIVEDIQEEEEKHPLSDSKISLSHSKLEEESSRCQKEIEILNSEIASLDSDIRRAEQREAEERKKAWEEYLASLTGGGNK